MKRPIKDALRPESKALPSTGPLSMSQIQDEFGGSNPISLSEYYGAASGVPASGTISISDFRGKSGEWISSFTNANSGGGAPGTFSGYAAVGSMSATTLSPVVVQGSMANRNGAIPPSNGVSTWVISHIGRNQNYGFQNIQIGFRDAAKSDVEINSPNYQFDFPGTVTLATNSAFTQNVVVVPTSRWERVDTSYFNKGTQVGWDFQSRSTDPAPDYNDFFTIFVNPNTVYIKIS